MTVAVREDHMDMAEFLLKKSACVDAVDQDQRLVVNNKSFDAHVNIKMFSLFTAHDF